MAFKCKAEQGSAIYHPVLIPRRVGHWQGRVLFLFGLKNGSLRKSLNPAIFYPILINAFKRYRFSTYRGGELLLANPHRRICQNFSNLTLS